GLALRAVVGLVVGIADPLDRRPANGAGLLEAAVDGVPRPERGDALGKLALRLRPQPIDSRKTSTVAWWSRATSSGFSFVVIASGDSFARWRISSEYAFPIPLKRW